MQTKSRKSCFKWQAHVCSQNNHQKIVLFNTQLHLEFRICLNFSAPLLVNIAIAEYYRTGFLQWFIYYTKNTFYYYASLFHWQVLLALKEKNYQDCLAKILQWTSVISQSGWRNSLVWDNLGQWIQKMLSLE